jgi:hypothetical protein
MTLDGEREMFSTTPLPLQFAGDCTACAATAPNTQTYRAAIAIDRLRNLDICRPFIGVPLLQLALRGIRPRLLRVVDPRPLHDASRVQLRAPVKAFSQKTSRK